MEVQVRSQEHITAVLAALERVILGKPLQLKIALVTLLARGHLLIEDLPGMGKTTLAHALAQVQGLACRRMQFTADLLPADLQGGVLRVPGERGGPDREPGRRSGPRRR